MRYVRLANGIVIRVQPDGATDWPYGPRQSRAIDGEPATAAEFNAQALAAWPIIAAYHRLLERVPSELYDVAFAAVGYAALTYDATRGGTLDAHVRRTVRFALGSARARNTQAMGVQLADHHSPEHFIGQIEANIDIYKYKALLSREQWLLLLARFDSGLSYDEIAREFRFASRTTAKNKIDQALEVCRRSTPTFLRESDTEKK